MTERGCLTLALSSATYQYSSVEVEFVFTKSRFELTDPGLTSERKILILLWLTSQNKLKVQDVSSINLKLMGIPVGLYNSPGTKSSLTCIYSVPAMKYEEIFFNFDLVY